MAVPSSAAAPLSTTFAASISEQLDNDDDFQPIKSKVELDTFVENLQDVNFRALDHKWPK